MSVLKKLLSDTAFYGLSYVLVRLLNYILVPIHTDILPTDEYGAVSKFYAYAALLNILYAYGMETAFFRFATDKELKPDEVSNTAQTSLLISSLLFSGILFLFSGSIAGFITTEAHAVYVKWFAVLFAVDALMIVPFARLRLERKLKKFATVKTLNVVFLLGLNILFLYGGRSIAKGDIFPEYQSSLQPFFGDSRLLGYVFLANILANGASMLLLAKEFMRFRLKLNRRLWQRMTLYSYPIILTGLAHAINEVADRYFLEWFLPKGFYPDKTALDVIGIYSACYKLSIFITIAVQAFKFAAEPFFFSKAKDKKSPELFAEVMRYFVITCSLMMVGVSLNLDLAQYFLADAAYREGINVVPILLLANVFLGMYYNLAVWYKVTDRTLYGTYMSFGGATVTILGNIILIPYLGYFGSAVATLGCYITMTLLSFWLGKKYYPIPYSLKAIFLYLAWSVAVVVTGRFSYTFPDFWLNILYQNVWVLIWLTPVILIERPRLRKMKF